MAEAQTEPQQVVVPQEAPGREPTHEELLAQRPGNLFRTLARAICGTNVLAGSAVAFLGGVPYMSKKEGLIIAGVNAGFFLLTFIKRKEKPRSPREKKRFLFRPIVWGSALLVGACAVGHYQTVSEYLEKDKQKHEASLKEAERVMYHTFHPAMIRYAHLKENVTVFGGKSVNGEIIPAKTEVVFISREDNPAGKVEIAIPSILNKNTGLYDKAVTDVSNLEISDKKIPLMMEEKGKAVIREKMSNVLVNVNGKFQKTNIERGAAVDILGGDKEASLRSMVQVSILIGGKKASAVLPRIYLEDQKKQQTLDKKATKEDVRKDQQYKTVPAKQLPMKTYKGPTV